jgi:hypothetical protein
MLFQLPQFFEDSEEGVVTFDLSFLRRVGDANLVAGTSATLEFATDVGSAGYVVEQGNNTGFQWGPGRSALKFARERQLAVELAARIVRGNPSLTLYIIQYDSKGARLRQATLRHARERFQGALTLARDVASYTVAIRLAGRGVVEFGEFRTRLDSADPNPDSGVTVAIAGSTPDPRLSRMNLIARVAGKVGTFDRRHLKMGADLTRRGLRRVSSKMGALAKRAQLGSTNVEPSASKDGLPQAAKSRSQLRLRKLNDDLTLSGKSNASAWLTEALAFAVSMECYETAERLTQYALATWPQIDPPSRQAMLVPLVEALTSVGDLDSARDLLETKAHTPLRDDKLVTHARMLGNGHERDAADFVLPSGRLDAFSLSRMKGDNAGLITSLFKSRKSLFAQEPQNYLLLCNAELEQSEALYCKYLNKYLARFDVGHATSVTFGDNILDKIRFHRGSLQSDGPRVSVIMAAYNAEKTVRYAVRSLLQQEYGNIELLICDDGSEDGTLAAVQTEAGEDERVRIFRSDSNQGPYNIRNALLKVAQGEYITFHDADDLALPSRIRLQVARLLEQKARAVIARWVRVRPSGEFVFFKDQSALRNALVSIMAPKEVFARYGPYRSVRFGGDTELKERIRNSEGDSAIYQMKQPLILGLWSDGSLTRQAGGEGLENGYRGPARRRLSELTVRQRLLGAKIMPEVDVVAAIGETGNIVEPSPIASVSGAGI